MAWSLTYHDIDQLLKEGRQCPECKFWSTLIGWPHPTAAFRPEKRNAILAGFGPPEANSSGTSKTLLTRSLEPKISKLVTLPSAMTATSKKIVFENDRHLVLAMAWIEPRSEPGLHEKPTNVGMGCLIQELANNLPNAYVATIRQQDALLSWLHPGEILPALDYILADDWVLSSALSFCCLFCLTNIFL